MLYRLRRSHLVVLPLRVFWDSLSACVMVTVVSKLLCVPSMSETRMKTNCSCRSCSKAQVLPSLEDGGKAGHALKVLGHLIRVPGNLCLASTLA